METEAERQKDTQRQKKIEKIERKKEEEEEAEDGRSRREKLLSKTTVIGSFSEGHIIRPGADLQRSAP